MNDQEDFHAKWWVKKRVLLTDIEGGEEGLHESTALQLVRRDSIIVLNEVEKLVERRLHFLLPIWLATIRLHTRTQHGIVR